MENKNTIPNGNGKGVVKVINLSGGYILPRISESTNKRKAFVEFYHFLWSKRSNWENTIKNIK